MKELVLKKKTEKADEIANEQLLKRLDARLEAMCAKAKDNCNLVDYLLAGMLKAANSPSARVWMFKRLEAFKERYYDGKRSPDFLVSYRLEYALELLAKTKITAAQKQILIMQETKKIAENKFNAEVMALDLLNSIKEGILSDQLTNKEKASLKELASLAMDNMERNPTENMKVAFESIFALEI